jgi:hypothetical protein
MVKSVQDDMNLWLKLVNPGGMWYRDCSQQIYQELILYILKKAMDSNNILIVMK